MDLHDELKHLHPRRDLQVTLRVVPSNSFFWLVGHPFCWPKKKKWAGAGRSSQERERECVCLFDQKLNLSP